MSKTIDAGLLADINRNVTSLAVILRIIRADGQAYNLTNFENDLTVDSVTYDSTIPFNLSATSSSSTLAVDNTELTLSLDGTTFVREDFLSGAFEQAAVEVSLVDWSDVASGEMIIRTGWFGQTIFNEQDMVKVTISGLLKLLDFRIGRIYQPTCDTDLGSDRCKVAIDDNQVRHHLNQYHVGEWVKYMDESQMTSMGLTNGDFSADGAVNAVGSITGWTRGPDCGFQVADGLVITEAEPDLPPPESDWFLWGGTTTNNNAGSGSGDARHVYQDIDLVVDAGMTTANIDANRYFSYARCWFSTLEDDDLHKMQVEYFDANGDILRSYDFDYVQNTFYTVWNGYNLTTSVPAGARTARIYIWFRVMVGVRFNNGANGVNWNWWDHTLTDPTDGVIYKAVRIVQFSEAEQYRLDNEGFENDGAVANGTSGISGWTQTGSDYFQVVASLGGLGAPYEGSWFVAGGDDSSGTQSTYNLEQIVNLSDVLADVTRIDIGTVAGRFALRIGHADTTSLAGYLLTFFDGENGTGSALGTVSYTPTTQSVAGWYGFQEDFTFPVNTRSVRFRLISQSPVGSSVANTGFDALNFYVIDGERPEKNDDVYGQGVSSTTFNNTAGAQTLDGNILWKTKSAFTNEDVVATVTSNFLFTGTSIAGADGTYETALIEWITGDNVGTKNVIRQWTSSTKTIKLYFQTINDIQVGDKFRYVTPCHKRFLEDCVLGFDNAINFQGFPYLPGKLS